MQVNGNQLAIVTGASSGIGYELAKLCAENGFDLVIAADEPAIRDAAMTLRQYGVNVQPVEVDLATLEGVDAVYAATQGRRVDALLANAGRGLGHAFLDEDFDEIKHVVDTNIIGTIYLVHQVGRDMRARGEGKILMTGSIAGYMPGSFAAVYNGTKAFVDSFAAALRNELKDTDISVTCLQPGPTETNFFERADMLDTRVGQAKKDDAADVAKMGFDAMMRGDGDVITGIKNKVLATMANLAPADVSAEMHRGMAEPGAGDSSKK
jgi:short-subunit dehydrogenase